MCSSSICSPIVFHFPLCLLPSQLSSIVIFEHGKVFGVKFSSFKVVNHRSLCRIFFLITLKLLFKKPLEYGGRIFRQFLNLPGQIFRVLCSESHFQNFTFCFLAYVLNFGVGWIVAAQLDHLPYNVLDLFLRIQTDCRCFS